MITEKPSVLLEELGTEPVFVLVTQSGALAITRSDRILGYDLERQFGDGGRLFGSVLPICSLSGLSGAGALPYAGELSAA